MPEVITDSRGSDIALGSARRYAPVVKANTDLPDGPCRGLLVGTAGTANLTELGGTQRDNVPLAAGYHPLIARQVRLGGTAADIWAIY